MPHATILPRDKQILTGNILYILIFLRVTKKLPAMVTNDLQVSSAGPLLLPPHNPISTE